MSAPDLAARMLQIAPEAWLETVADFQREVPPAPPGETVEDELRRSLGALARVFRRHDPHTAPAAAADAPTPCPACGEHAVAPLLTRLPSMRYGRCASCGHGVLLGDGAPADEAAVHARYAGPDYYRVRTSDGVGYDGYDREAAYREAKGARLVERLRAAMPALQRLLEVGSGYGFTRAAAERAGIRTAGVDLNADAGAEAARRYQLGTFCGTLAQALLSPVSEIAAGTFDIALYQFVLEHVVVVVELRERAVDGGATFFLSGVADLIDLRPVENGDPFLAAFVLPPAVARVVAQADRVPVFIAELGEGGIGEERAADVGGIEQVRAQELEQLVLVFDRIFVGIDLEGIVRLVEHIPAAQLDAAAAGERERCGNERGRYARR